MLYVHYLMKCRKCSKPILLPHPKNHDMQSNPAEWPMGDWKKFFLCLECKQVSEYSGTCVQMVIQDIQSPWELDVRRCWSIRYDCDEGSCDTQIETRAISDASVDPQTILDIFLCQPSVPRLCPSGKHWAQAPPHPKQFRVVWCSFPY
jgi:hypothetical protein